MTLVTRNMECPPRWQRNSANAANADDCNDAAEEEKTTVQTGITQEQYDKLINLLQSSSTSGTTTSQANFVAKHGMNSFESFKSGILPLICLLSFKF